MLGNDLHIGNLVGNGKPVTLPASARERQTFICGGTGVGKSKLFEDCIQQDILNHRDSKCGLILFDPHGLVYNNTMAWLADSGLKRPIVPIDLRRDDWIVSYNLLRRRDVGDSSVIVSNFVRALAHVWGQGGTDQTPLFAFWATVLLQTLYQNNYTVADVMHLLSRDDIRQGMIARVENEMANYAWQKADRRPKDFDHDIQSTVSRFQRLIGPKVMNATFGQPDVSLDLLSAIEEGKIILVNLSTEGGMIDDEHADTFATLLLSDLWAAAKARGKGESEKIKPFYVYIDECQKFITPTIADNLDQARGFGLHLTLANQYPKRLINSGPMGQAMYDSIMANAGNKIVFRLEHPEDAKMLGEWLFMNTFDTDAIKLKLDSTKVVGYREETRESRTTGSATTHATSTGRGRGAFHGVSASDGVGGSQSFDPTNPGSDPLSSVESWNNSVTDSSGESESWSESESEANTTSQSVTRSKVLVPVMGKEVSSVQYRTIDEQIFRAMQKLFDQKDRHYAIRFFGGPKAPLFVKTPTVTPPALPKKAVEKYRISRLKKLKFALPMAKAEKRQENREQKLLTEVVDIPEIISDTTAKRRIKRP